MPVVRIDEDVWKELQKRAVPLVDNPNSVLRRVLNLSSEPPESKPNINPSKDNMIEIPISVIHSMVTYYVLPIPQKFRLFFPGYREPFTLETDIGNFKTHVTSAPGGAKDGDPNAGTCIQTNLKKWFDNHPELASGYKLRYEVVEPYKRYKLTVVSK